MDDSFLASAEAGTVTAFTIASHTLSDIRGSDGQDCDVACARWVQTTHRTVIDLGRGRDSSVV